MSDSSGPETAALFAEKLIRMRENDFSVRQSLLDAGELYGGYHPRMEAVHRENAGALREIIDRIGYPTIEKVGADASDAAWLIVQHAIGEPDFMRKIYGILQSLPEGAVDPKDIAFLEDRIHMYEGKPQRYGTQFDFDDSGILSPVAFDDLNAVNRRRAALGMNSLEERTDEIRREQNSTPSPDELKEQRAACHEWLVKTGWRKR